MKINQIIFVFFAVLVLLPFNMPSYLMAASDNDANKTPKQCGCDLKEAKRMGDWQSAYNSAKQLITASPKSPEAQDAYLWLGLYYKSQHDFDESTRFYQKAVDLYPGTWASAEATARTGCNYYKQNNYSKALLQFREAASNAQTWKQRKYASTWAKWVHFALEGKDNQLVANCATKSIEYYLNSKGVKLNKEKFVSSLTLKEGLIPLPKILKFLKKEDVKLNALKCPIERIQDIGLPFVAVVKPSHLIVVKGIETGSDKKIIVYDPVQGEISYYEKELAKIWSDKVLTTSIPSNTKFASLSKKELKNISLGTCYCCPEQPITGCGEGGSSCPSCGGAESGVGGIGGGTGSGSGTGGCTGGTCLASIGFPKITVYTSSLTLIVRDTPIGYNTAVGEDVKVSMTFNSDLSYSGVFGNSWHSNIETSIKENEDYSVTVTGSGGHDDTFTYSGGQYNSPVGVVEKLVKNSDDTFTLESTKSHKKYHYNTSANGGKLLSIEDKDGNIVSIQYDVNDNFNSITDAVGRVTDIQTDSSGRITLVTDPLGRDASFAYDSNDNLTQVVDMAGNTFIYTYDENKNITSLTEPKGTYTLEYGQYSSEIWVSSITDPNGNKSEYGGEWPTYVKDPRGNYTYYYSDWYSSWPYYGDTVKIEDALGNYVSYTYDDNRNRTEITNKRGNTTYYAYDANHNMLSKTDPLGNSWAYVYDANNNNMISTTDPRGKVTNYVYDGNNNLLSATEQDPNNIVLSVISYDYDHRGRNTSITKNGNVTTYNYATNGNLIQIIDPEGGITTFAYDTIGRKTSMTNDANVTTSYEYDDLNRITKIIHPDLTYIQYVYSCCGLTQQRDENNKITYYEYDSLGRRTKVADAAENETTYAYDSVGNLVSLTDAKGNTTTYTYDAVNRVTSITYPLGESESYTYDAEGNLLTKTDSKGGITYYTYDADNRLNHIKY